MNIEVLVHTRQPEPDQHQNKEAAFRGSVGDEPEVAGLKNRSKEQNLVLPD